MKVSFSAATKSITDVKGELTAAALMIPVSLALQSFVQGMVNDAGHKVALFGVMFSLAGALLVSVFSVAVLSIAIDHVWKWLAARQFWYAFLVVFASLWFVGWVLVASAVAPLPARLDVSRQYLLAAFLLPLLLVLVLFDEDESLPSEDLLVLFFFLLTGLVLIVLPW